ncbi:hypothetical protein ACFC1B_28590 [Streptomyces xiamenensis]|uniref:hypothetical protein n=1 Tax=Streptomyces xiamenensis TaxID=408015 RepID=UPI0035E03A8F
MTDLDHLLDRARRGVLLPEEADWLAERVGELVDAQQRYARALDRTHALADDLDGPGSIDRAEAAGLLRDVLDVRPGVWRQTPALAPVAPSTPLSAAVAASDPAAGPERHPGGSTGRQTGTGGVALAATAPRAASAPPSTATSGPQSAVQGSDGDLEHRDFHGAAGGRTAARGAAAIIADRLGGSRPAVAVACRLVAGGFTAADLARATDAELLAVPGLGPATLAIIRIHFT